MDEKWYPALAEAAFPEDGKTALVINGWHVLIAHDETGYHAVNDRCTHAASPLSAGRIRRGTVMCLLHGARFDLVSGRCLGGGHRSLRTFPLRIVDGMIEISVPSVQPAMDEIPIQR